MNQHPKTRRYRIAFKHNHIEIYEQIGLNIDALFSQIQTAFQLDPGLTSRLQSEVHDAPYTLVLRFIFFDPTRQWFSTKRMCYRGSIDGRLELRQTGPIVELACVLIPASGTNQFYELS